MNIDFVANKEIKSVLRSNENTDINLKVPVPNPNVNIQEITLTNFSKKSLQASFTNLASKLDANRIKMKFRWAVKAKGKTYINSNIPTPNAPNADIPASTGTTAYLIGNDNFFMNPFYENDIISSFTMNNVVKDLERSPAINRITNLNYDRESCIKKYGLDPTLGLGIGFDMSECNISTLCGGGLYETVEDNFNYQKAQSRGHYKNTIEWVVNHSPIFKKNIHGGNTKIITTGYTTTEQGVILTMQPDKLGNMIPYDGQDVYFSDMNRRTNAYELTQDLIIETVGYLTCDWFVKNMYSFDPQPFIINLDDGSLNLNVIFSESEMQKMFKSTFSSTIINNTFSYNTVVVPDITFTQLAEAKIEVYSYDTVPVEWSPNQKIHYLSPIYNNILSSSLPSLVPTSGPNPNFAYAPNNKKTLTFPFTNEDAMARFYLIFGDMYIDKNNNIVGLMNSTRGLNLDISEVALKVGSKLINVLDIYSIDDLFKMTAGLMKDPLVREMVYNGIIQFFQENYFQRQNLVLTADLVDGVDGLSDVIAGFNELKENLANLLRESNDISRQRNVRFNFLIIDTTQLNLGMYPQTSIPMSPLVNYGKPLNYTFDITFEPMKYLFTEPTNGLLAPYAGQVFFDAYCVPIRDKVAVISENKLDVETVSYTAEQFNQQVLRLRDLKVNREVEADKISGAGWYQDIDEPLKRVVKGVIDREEKEYRTNKKSRFNQ